MRAAHASLVVLACVLTAARANAQEPPEPDAAASPRIALRHDVWIDGIATGVLAGSLVAWTFARSSALGSDCTICTGRDGGELNGLDSFFRDGLRRRDTDAAKTAGDIVSYGVGPAMGLVLTYGTAAAEHRADEAPLNALLVAEASLAAIVVNEGLGAVIRRARPTVTSENDAVASFPSGSTASIMAITSATATVATLRGYRLAPLVWFVGTTLGLTATYLQIAADRSYLTDNVVGAAVGLGVGAAVPLLFHRPVGEHGSNRARARWLEGAMLTSTAVPGGRVVGVALGF